MKLNPIIEAWRRATHEERREFVRTYEFDLIKIRHETDPRMEIPGNNPLALAT
jgi:hypothetical protein